MTEGQLYGPERKEEKNGRKAAGYQDQHDTYGIKIKKNMITVNNLVYKYRIFLSLKIIRKTLNFLCIKKFVMEC